MGADERRRALKVHEPVAYWACNYMWLHMAARTDFAVGASQWEYEGDIRLRGGMTNMLPWRPRTPGGPLT